MSARVGDLVEAIHQGKKYKGKVEAIHYSKDDNMISDQVTHVSVFSRGDPKSTWLERVPVTSCRFLFPASEER